MMAMPMARSSSYRVWSTTFCVRFVVRGVHQLDGIGAVGLAVRNEVLCIAVVQALRGSKSHLLDGLHAASHRHHAARGIEFTFRECKRLHAGDGGARLAMAGRHLGLACGYHFAPVKRCVVNFGRRLLAFAHRKNVVVIGQVAAVGGGGEALHQVGQQVVFLQQLPDVFLRLVAALKGQTHSVVGPLNDQEHAQVGQQCQQHGGEESAGNGAQFHRSA
jgi:hypothetical protein